jgi:hypothetical protein
MCSYRACRRSGKQLLKGWALGLRKERLVASFENTVMIGRPIEEVFGFLSDFENVPGGTTPSARPTRCPRGRSAWGRSTSKSARFRAEAKSASRSPPTTRPATWRSKANSGRSHPPRLCPGRRSRGNPHHQLGRAGTPWPGPPTWASRRAPCPGRRGRQPPQAQGTAGAIGPCPAEGSDLQPGLGSDRRQSVVDRAPTGTAGVGG